MVNKNLAFFCLFLAFTLCAVMAQDDCNAQCIMQGHSGGKLFAVGQTKSIPPSVMYRCVCFSHYPFIGETTEKRVAKSE